MGPTFLKSLFNFRFRSAVRSMGGRVIWSGNQVKEKKDKTEPSLLVNKPKQKVTDNEITWKFLRNFIDALLKRSQYRNKWFRHQKVGQDTPPQKTPKCQRCLTNSKLPRQKTSKIFSVKLMWKYHEQLQLHFTALCYLDKQKNLNIPFNLKCS